MPFRWQFIPTKDEGTGAILWTWRAYAQTGALAMQAAKSFDSLTECHQDARAAGYDKP